MSEYFEVVDYTRAIQPGKAGGLSESGVQPEQGKRRMIRGQAGSQQPHAQTDGTVPSRLVHGQKHLESISHGCVMILSTESSYDQAQRLP